MGSKKDRGGADMKTFFTSDHHFGHTNIIRYQKRSWLKPGDLDEQDRWVSQKIAAFRIKEMDDGLIKSWNDSISKDDVVYHLGDFCFGGPDDAIKYLDRLNFKKFNFIYGNHDRAMEDLQGRSESYPDVTFLGNMQEIKVQGQTIVLNHYAMRVWNRSHYGSWHVYGHSHGSLCDDPHSLSFDVGVDCNNYQPVSFEQVAERMKKKLFIPIDHHGRQEGGGIGLGKEAFEKSERRRIYEQLKTEFESNLSCY